MVAPAVAIPVLLQLLSAAQTQIPKLHKQLTATAEAATKKAQGFDAVGVTGGAATAAPAGPNTREAADAVHQLGAGCKKVHDELAQARGADAQQARTIILGAFGSAENFKGLIDTATQKTAAGNAAMEAGTGSAAHVKSQTGGLFGAVQKVIGPIGESLLSVLASGKATGEQVGVQASA